MITVKTVKDEVLPKEVQLQIFLSDQGKRVLAENPGLESFFPERKLDANAYDLRAALLRPVMLFPGMILNIPLGFHGILTDKNYVTKLYVRSGLGSKGFVLRNGTGIIDWNYENEWVAMVVNQGENPITIAPGDRIVQATFVKVKYPTIVVLEEEKFPTTSERGLAGFGSSGVN